MQLLAIRNEGHGVQRGADDLPAAADQLSPPWARATQLVQWYRSSGTLDVSISRGRHNSPRVPVCCLSFVCQSPNLRILLKPPSLSLSKAEFANSAWMTCVTPWDPWRSAVEAPVSTSTMCMMSYYFFSVPLDVPCCK